MSAHDYVLVDVFTHVPLAGNQLAVFTDANGIPAGEMQRLALELKLSESVFVLPGEDGGDARVRIFTPAAELPFAGHPVLGAAVVLGIERARDEIVLETGAGPVPVRLTRVGRPANTAYGTMRQPIPTWREYDHTAELLAALDVERSHLPVEAYVNGPTHVYIALDSEMAVAVLEPDMHALKLLSPRGRSGELGVSCFAGGGRRFKTRMFAPGLGVDEDPATGSAAGPLAVHLARHGLIAFGDEIEIRQGAELGRPSLLRARVLGSRERIERVEVGGSAVIVARGGFLLT